MPRSILMAAALMAAASLSTAAAPEPTRLPLDPGWREDLTASARIVSGLAPGEAVGRGDGAPFLPSPSRTLVWELPLSVPDRAGDWPVALELDEARVLRSLRIGTTPLRLPEALDSADVEDGRAAVVLPLAAGASAILTLEATGSTAFFGNGFGRARLRPATLTEVLRLSWTDGRVTVLNHSEVDLQANLHLRHEDFFGTVLGSQTLPFSIGGGQRRLLSPAPVPSGAYKTVVWTSAGDRTSLPHWQLHQRGLERPQRLHSLALRDGWQVSYDEPDAALPPAGGWDSVRLPHAAAPERMKGHAVWYRVRLSVPDDWPPGRIHLDLQRVQFGAELFANGRRVAERGWHELPSSVELPAGIRGSDTLEIALRVRDASGMLSPGIPIPQPGKVTVPSRGLGAPIGPAWALPVAGLPTIPELHASPAVHTRSVALNTRLDPSGTWKLSARVDADTRALRGTGWRLRLSVLLRGNPLASTTGDLTQGGDFSWETEFANAQPWTPDTPTLHEFRTEILAADGTVADVHRERFGFREFKVLPGGFVLNGRRVRLHGGSHVQPESRLWPLRLVPHLLLRYDFGNPDRFLGGPTFRHMAEETGYLIKAASPEHNAHGADNYGYEHGIFWERARAHWENNIAALRNSPSIVLWDLGNEVSFQRSGDADAMQALADHIHSIDPARDVTIGGSAPGLPRSRLANIHGGGFWGNRLDHYMLNPSERPAYLRDRGIYARRPDGDSAAAWVARSEFLAGFTPRAMMRAPDLAHYDGRPILWAEGHYVGEGDTSMPALLGNDYYTPHVVRGESDWSRIDAIDQVHYLSGRIHSITTVRQAGADGSMIHVNRGFGRPLLPVAALPFDRNFRARAGSKWSSSWTLLNDTQSAREVAASWRLLSGSSVLAEATASATLEPGALLRVPVSLAIPASASDVDARLDVSVRSGGVEVFDDSHAFTLLAPTAPVSTGGCLFDPHGSLGNVAETLLPGFTPLKTLGEWDHAKPLLVGRDGLTKASAADLQHLRAGVLGGGTIALLEHASLPGFLPATLTQSDTYLAFAAPTWPESPLLRGLGLRDFRNWSNPDRDGIVAWGALELPASGNWINHVDAGGASGLLEVRQGSGRVLFCQLRVAASAHLDPAAERLLANIGGWFAAPSPFPARPAFVATADGRIHRTLSEQFGLEAASGVAPTDEFLSRDGLLVLSAAETAVRPALDERREALRAFMERGGTLLVLGLDESGAEWVSSLLGTTVGVEEFAHTRAHLTGWNWQTRAMLHGQFFFSQEGRGNWALPERKLAAARNSVAHLRITGSAVRPLLEPNYLAEVRFGRGGAVLSTLRALEYPTRVPRLAFAALLSNLGPAMQVGGISSGPKETVSWNFKPIDLGPFANHPLSDQPDGRHGYHGGGPENDMGHFPRGRQTLEGVEYLLIDPARHNGNGVIALSGTKEKGILPAEMKGIPVNAKADRLHFLHNSAWGLPGFTYRVWYEDRKTWIFGRPDPFVDVTVKPGENIADWYDATPIARGETFAPGLRIAWKAGNPNSLRSGREVGVYEMIWDNPHPEKVIESIDILSPGTVGSGQVFVFAITAATRAAAASPKPLESVAPGVRREDVAAEFFNGRYGIVLANDGSVPAIYDERGVRLASLPGWYFQRSGGERAVAGASGKARRRSSARSTRPARRSSASAAPTAICSGAGRSPAGAPRWRSSTPSRSCRCRKAHPRRQCSFRSASRRRSSPKAARSSTGRTIRR